MSRRHFTAIEQEKIEELKKSGYPTRAIGVRIGRHHSSIARELSRCAASARYLADAAQKNYRDRRQNSKPCGKLNKELKEIIIEKLPATWSPE